MLIEKRIWKLAAVALGVLFSGCTTMQTETSPSLLLWDDSVEAIGPVSFCKGEFCNATDEGSQPPLSLELPPEAPTYYQALQQKASSIYRVPVGEVVLRDVNITLSTEAVGIVRGWKADADAGRRRPKQEKKKEEAKAEGRRTQDDTQSSIKSRLRQLQELRDEGLISADEYDSRRQAILDQL